MKSLSLILLAPYADSGWTLRIGDPTFIGWFTAICYFAVAYLCYQNARKLTSINGINSLTVSWWLITLVLLFLGFNKQLDLQNLITEIGRRIAIEQGWYEKRRTVQRELIIVMATVGLATLLASAWILRKHLRNLRLVFIGVILLLIFIVARAASFHHVDRFLGFRIAGFRMNWVLELGGLILIGVGAYKQRREICSN